MYQLTLAEAPAQKEPKDTGQENETEPKHLAPDLKCKEREKGEDWCPGIPLGAKLMTQTEDMAELAECSPSKTRLWTLYAIPHLKK